MALFKVQGLEIIGFEWSDWYDWDIWNCTLNPLPSVFLTDITSYNVLEALYFLLELPGSLSFHFLISFETINIFFEFKSSHELFPTLSWHIFIKIFRKEGEDFLQFSKRYIWTHFLNFHINFCKEREARLTNRILIWDILILWDVYRLDFPLELLIHSFLVIYVLTKFNTGMLGWLNFVSSLNLVTLICLLEFLNLVLVGIVFFQ